MAASGISEHNEARRKERTLQKIAYQKRNISERMAAADLETGGHIPVTSESPSGGTRHDAAHVDAMRRQQHRQQQLCDYSAKIPNRFSSIDYAAQW